MPVNASYFFAEGVESTDVAAETVMPATEAPGSFKLLENYPDPFYSKTRIRFSTPEFSHVRIDVFNILGRPVAILADTRKTAGIHEVVFDARYLPSGLYFYRLQTTGRIETKQMLLIR
ncbi:MAG: hypothetical protein BMS9Abin05_2089 [Rhodothermia bacterium]|nr:MAG: hypothetical protein BMS9Abin05_2089 [Rhodothermia bacterium]